MLKITSVKQSTSRSPPPYRFRPINWRGA